MRLISGILHVCCLSIIFSWTVDATIEIFDPFGRRVDKVRDREAIGEDIEVMEGFIVTTDPSDACLPVEEPSFLTNFTYGKFALINGSDTCEYIDKIHNAGQAGFDLAVIYSPISGSVGYIGFELEIPPIPSVLISYEDGLLIRNNYLYNNSCTFNYRIKVKPNIPDLSYYMYLFGAVIGICFFVMILFMMCLLIKCIQERRKSRRNRLSSRQIRQIPTAKFTKGDQYDVCAICLDDYNEGDKLRILPCSHAYHAKCIDPWLMNNRRNCPLCKRKITFGDSADESDSEDSELTSPTENTPLLASPSNQQVYGQSWGTFVNPVRTVNDTDTGGPSSMPDFVPHISNSQHHPPLVADNWLVSDSESENLLPPSHFSVNNEKAENANQFEVQVNFVNPFEGETSSNHAASI